MLPTYKIILNQQQTWAKRRGIKFDDDGYTLLLSDNLFSPLLSETKREFKSGKGDELGEGNNRGKMQALHSSSALVVNVFDYWRSHNVATIAQACGASLGITQMQFERTYATPLGGIPPHLDIEFYGITDIIPIVIESKFTEPYHRKMKRRVKDKYVNYQGLWAQLPGCESLIRRIREEEKSTTSFSYLDAPQLLKHILGLSTKFGHKGFELRCGIESRLLQYWEANRSIHQLKKAGWEIPKIARDLEKAFIRRDKIARIDVLDSAGIEHRISLYFTPVTKDLEALGGKIGNLMHCPELFRTSDDPWWDQTREFLEQVYAELEKANKGTLLGVPVLRRKTNSVHLEIETKLGESIEDPQSKLGELGERILIKVKYLDDLPENV